MECNKDEALKAKQVAEVRMQSNDFAGALRFVQKAQRLYPQLEGIAQMLAVCEVHCAAEKKSGSEEDWYAILQIGTAADEITIKKQYRKLALLLHPDKNKFAGSEAAFKVIGEANRILADQGKRTLYDVKRKSSATMANRRPAAHQSTQNASFSKHFSGNTKPGNASSSQFPNGSQPQQAEDNAFWTMCPLCKVKYQYLSRFLHKALLCQSCKKPFIAFKVDASGKTAWSQKASTHQKDVPNGGSLKDDHSRNHPSKSKCDTGGDGGAKVQADAKVHMHAKPENKGREMPKLDPTQVKAQEKGNMNGSRKRGRNCPTDHDATSDDVASKKSKADTSHVSVDDIKQGTDGVASKKSKADTSHVSVGDIKQGTDDDSVASEENGKSKPDADTTSEPDSCPEERKLVECPDPEFNDFDKDKAEGCFAAGQVWACYDTADGMPRFYAKVVKVLSPGFRLKYTWFEAAPDDDAEILWNEEDLPIACGKYRRGKTDDTTDILMFSHQMHLISGDRRGSFLVYPRKGETWALFKNWDIKWSSEPEKHTSFDYDFVEVLSDFDKETGITVAPLVKVKGFISLFERSDKDQSFQISKCDLYRFSHRIPSFKMTGKEKKGVPVGCFELDTAALPANVLADAGNVTNGDNVVKPMESSKTVEPPKNTAKENGVGGEPCVRRSPRGQEKISRADDLFKRVQTNKNQDTVMEDAQKSGTSTSKSDKIPPSKVGNASSNSMSTPKKLEEKNIKPDTSASKSGTSTGKSDKIPPSKVGNASSNSMSTPKKREEKNIKPDTSAKKRFRVPRGMLR